MFARIKEKLAEIAFKRALKGRLDKIMNWINKKLDGKRTYITVWLGAVLATLASAMGGLDLPGEAMDIPPLNPKEIVGLWWGAIAFTFLRKGVKKAEK